VNTTANPGAISRARAAITRALGWPGITTSVNSRSGRRPSSSSARAAAALPASTVR